MNEANSKVALLSVYNKDGIEDFAGELSNLGYEVYASGGTAKRLSQAGVSVKDVSSLVGGDAILGHRVVTLSREISAGLLADKHSEQDMAELESLGLPFIDLVCVDMYPLEETIGREDSALKDVTEQTDIGGPTMLRCAAKGRRVVVSHPSQRQEVIKWLKDGRPEETAFLEELAARAEYESARYILVSAKYLNGAKVSGELHYITSPTKYGENPQQQPAALYADNRLDDDPLSIERFQHIQGMERSFINITDIDRLLQTVTHIAAGFEINFKDVPSIAVGVKHGNACGAGISDSIDESIKKMIDGDRRAIFGGVVMVNGPIDKSAAGLLLTYGMDKGKRLLDGVVAASVTEEALELLSRNKLRVVVNPALNNLGADSLDKSPRIRQVRGGLLMQPNYSFVIDLNAGHIETSGKVDKSQRRDLVLAWAIGSTSNSNTITLTKGGKLIGNGVGQQDRVGAGQLALTRSTEAIPEISDEGDRLRLSIVLDKHKLKGACAYSDSFFPFPDGPELLAKAGIKAILSSSGSLGDEVVKETLGKYGVGLIMVPDRSGRGFYMH